jgi:hypothetical protein
MVGLEELVTTEKRKRGPGRPPADADSKGRPRKTSEYPKLVAAIRPETKALLKRLSRETRKPIWRIVDEAVWAIGQTGASPEASTAAKTDTR